MSPSSFPETSPRVATSHARHTGTTGAAVALLLGITLIFYYGLWLPGLVLVKRDAFGLFLPLKQHIVERLSSGDLPQWFPYEALGRPFIGSAHTGVFHPYTALYFLLSAPDAYRASTLLSCLLAALGAFTLGRTLAFSRSGALVAGLSFALSGYVVSLTDNIVYLYSLCALPLFCAALEKAMEGSRPWMVAAAGMWASVFLNGDVQTGYYYGLISLLWIGLRAPGSFLHASLRVAIIGGLAALLAGVQLAPSAAVFLESDRAQSALFHEEALHWSTHPLRLLTLWASPIGEDLDSIAVASYFFAIPNHGLWAESLYLGVPVTGLAVLGAWHRRDLKVLALLGGLALLLSLGRYGGLYELFYHVVPLWSAFRYPEKFMGVVSFATAMLAGAGLDTLRSGLGRAAPWLMGGILCMGAGLALSTEAASAWTADAFGAPTALAHAVTGSAGLAFIYSAAAACGLGLILTGLRKGFLRATPALVALTALIALDLARANLGAYHTGPAEAVTFAPPAVQALAEREGALGPGRFRMVSLDWNRYVLPEPLTRSFGIYTAGAMHRRFALEPEHNVQFHIESAERYLPGFSPRLAAMFERQLGIEAAARYNVSYYVGRRFRLRDPVFAARLVADFPAYDLALFRNPAPAKPRAYLSRHPERATAPIDPAALITRPDFLNDDIDVIETMDPALPGPATDGSAVIERYTPEEVRIRVDAPQSAVLVLLDAFDKGWTATLDGGAELPILRANALVRAVIVPAGAHAVTFSYRTPLLTTGACASLAGLLCCVGLLAYSRWSMNPTRDHA